MKGSEMSENNAGGAEQAPRLTVLGAGGMGGGITTLAVGHGVPVTLVDVDQAKRDAADARIAHELRIARLMGALPDDLPTGELVISDSVSDAAGSTAVIEAVTEAAEVKEKVIAE